MNAKTKNQADCALLVIKDNNLVNPELSGVLEECLRINDYYGELDGKCCVLLSNANSREAETVVKRLKSRGLGCKIESWDGFQDDVL